MPAHLDFDCPLSPPAPWSDSSNTPDSGDVANASLSWPFDVSVDPDELHDFIFHTDEHDPAAFLFDGEGDSGQPAGGETRSDDVAQDLPPRGGEAAAAAVPERGEATLYAPIHRSLRAKRVVCQSACVHCRRAKTRCDGQRPCSRCTAHGRAGECQDRPADEIERGRQNRKRKPRAQSNKAGQQQHPNSSDDQQSPAAAPVAPARARVSLFDLECQSLTSPAARLAFGQSTILRHSTVDRVNRLCATRPAADPARRYFIRGVHLFFVKWADALSAAEFDLFVRGRLPGTDPTAAVAPLPPCLRMWERVETRPLFLDWSPSPSVCDADTVADAPPTLRITTGPAAQRAVHRWESRVAATSPQQEPSEAQVQGAAAQPVEELFSCLGIADSPAHSAAGAEDARPRTSPLHAPWCPVRTGIAVGEAAAPCSDPAHPPAPLPCVCFHATALPISMSVNAAWEALYGWSQAEVREQLLQRGSSIQTEWFEPESWWSLHCLLASHALIDKRNGYRFRAFVLIRTRHNTELPCMVDKRIVDSGDGSSQAVLNITPLEQLAQPQPVR